MSDVEIDTIVRNFFSQNDIFAETFNHHLREETGFEVCKDDLIDLGDLNLSTGDTEDMEIVKLWRQEFCGAVWNILLRLVITYKSGSAYRSSKYVSGINYHGENIPVYTSVLCFGLDP